MSQKQRSVRRLLESEAGSSLIFVDGAGLTARVPSMSSAIEGSASSAPSAHGTELERLLAFLDTLHLTFYGTPGRRRS